MPSPELRSGVWSVVILKPDKKRKRFSKNEKGERFADEDEAFNYGLDVESDIRRGRWVDPDAPKMTFGEWAWTWYAGQTLEPTTLAKYRSLLENHLNPRFKERTLASFRPEEMGPWEREMVAVGYAPRTAYDARSLLISILGDAVPQYIGYNPAARRRGKGLKATRRVERVERAVKSWPTPGQAIVLAERGALLYRDPVVFLALITLAWTGLRWSELLGLTPASLLEDGRLDVKEKLYQLGGSYYRQYPKDGSIRILDMPPFLNALLAPLAEDARACTCKGRRKDLSRFDGEELVEWCAGRRYMFLRPGATHYHRGRFREAVMRPAADGAYTGKEGKNPRPARPVIAEVSGEFPYPGKPLQPAWPYAVKDEVFLPPQGRGYWTHDPHDPVGRQVATWLPVALGLTPHGFRHGHQTWLDDAGEDRIKKSLKKERMGHEDSSMSGRYGHITDGMRHELVEYMETLWRQGLAQRATIHPRSPLPLLDEALAPWREDNVIMIPQNFPRSTKGRLSM